MRQTWKKYKQRALLMKIISLWLNCHQTLQIFPPYRMMFVLHLRWTVTCNNEPIHSDSHIRPSYYSTPNTGSFVTPCTSQPFHSNSDISWSFSSKLDSLEAKLCDKIMAMKSIFMDEFHTIKNKSLTSAKIRKTSTIFDHDTVDSFQTKIKLLETENKLLKNGIKNEQRLINSTLVHNSNLI